MSQAFNLKNGTILLSTEAPGGLYNAAQLKKIAAILDQNVAIVRATEDQRLALFVKEADASRVAEELKTIGLGIRHYQSGLHQPVACIGELCPDHDQDALGSAMDVTQAIADLTVDVPLKIGINGCARCCVACHTFDVSVIGDASGYRINLGGKSSQIPEMASFMAEGVPATELPGLVRKVVELYRRHSNEGETLQDVMDRVGAADFIEALKPYSQDAAHGADDVFGGFEAEPADGLADLNASTDAVADLDVSDDLGASEPAGDDLGVTDELMADIPDLEEDSLTGAAADDPSEPAQDFGSVADDDLVGGDDLDIDPSDFGAGGDLDGEVPIATAGEPGQLDDALIDEEELGGLDAGLASDADLGLDAASESSSQTVSTDDDLFGDIDDDVALDEAARSDLGAVDTVGDFGNADAASIEADALASDDDFAELSDDIQVEAPRASADLTDDLTLDDDLLADVELVEEAAPSDSPLDDTLGDGDVEPVLDAESLTEEDERSFEDQLNESIAEEETLMAQSEPDENSEDRLEALTLVEESVSTEGLAADLADDDLTLAPDTGDEEVMDELELDDAELLSEAAEDDALRELDGQDLTDLEPLAEVDDIGISEDRLPYGLGSDDDDGAQSMPLRSTIKTAAPRANGSARGTASGFNFAGLHQNDDGHLVLAFDSGATIGIDPARFQNGEKTLRLGDQEVTIRAAADGYRVTIDGMEVYYPTKAA